MCWPSGSCSTKQIAAAVPPQKCLPPLELLFNFRPPFIFPNCPLNFSRSLKRLCGTSEHGVGGWLYIRVQFFPQSSRRFPSICTSVSSGDIDVAVTHDNHMIVASLTWDCTRWATQRWSTHGVHKSGWFNVQTSVRLGALSWMDSQFVLRTAAILHACRTAPPAYCTPQPTAPPVVPTVAFLIF